MAHHAHGARLATHQGQQRRTAAAPEGRTAAHARRPAAGGHQHRHAADARPLDHHLPLGSRTVGRMSQRYLRALAGLRRPGLRHRSLPRPRHAGARLGGGLPHLFGGAGAAAGTQCAARQASRTVPPLGRQMDDGPRRAGHGRLSRDALHRDSQSLRRGRHPPRLYPLSREGHPLGRPRHLPALRTGEESGARPMWTAWWRPSVVRSRASGPGW